MTVKSALIVALLQVSERLQEPCYVTGQLIDLEVDARPDRQGAERRNRLSVRNDVDRKAAWLHRVDGQAHPIHGDGALGRHEALERSGHSDAEAQGTRIGFAGEHFTDTVDVPRHQVSAERSEERRV